MTRSTDSPSSLQPTSSETTHVASSTALHHKTKVQSSNQILRGLALGLLVTHSALATPQIQFQAIPLIASSAGSPTAFPTVSSSGFEDPRIDGNPVTLHYYGLQTPPNNQWQSWTFLGTSGIALDGSPITVLNPNAPEPTHVAFLEGTGSVSTAYGFQPGTYRLRFQGMQRIQAGGVDQQVVKVEIGATKVAVIELSSTSYTEYVTRPIRIDFNAIMPVTFSGLVANQIALVDDIRIEPISEWDDSATWGGFVPGNANPVTIPTGVAVALKKLGNKAADVTVHGELLVADRNADLKADEVLVDGATARLEAGTEGVPFEQVFTLELKGTDSGIGGNDKGLVVTQGGTIHLHGKPKKSWTKLVATANANTNVLSVEDVSGWEPGDEVIVTSSRHQRSQNTPGVPDFVDYSDQRTIASLDPVAKTVTLTSNLANKHNGSATTTYTSPPTPQYPSGQTWVFDQRAEVGMLTHNVKVQGNAASATSEFGGHIMVTRPGGTTNGGAAYLSNVELYRMGQKKHLGRYPIHWHLMVNLAQGQYIEDCSIHDTYNRAVTIHGTDFVRVERNVANRNVGHAVFLENGGEQWNVIRDNLVVNTLQPPTGQQMLISDNELEQLQNRCPASFWITNPMNEITGNIAAGTEGTGFWFILPGGVLGNLDSVASNYLGSRSPQTTDLGTFDGNVCHTSGSAFDVNDSIDPGDDHILTNVAWHPPTTPNLTNFTAYGCDMGVYAGTSPYLIEFQDCKISDNNENIRFAAYHTVRNSVVVANSGNVTWGTGPQFAYVVYDGAGTFMDSHVVNFDQPTTFVISGAGAATLHPNPRFLGLTYNHATLPKINFSDFAAWVDSVGAPVNTNYSDPHNLANGRKYGMALRDLDGSLWGVPGSTVLGNHLLMHVPSADVTPPNPPTANVRVSTLRFGHFRIKYPNVNPLQYPAHTMKREAHSAYGDSGTIAFLDPFTTGNHKQTPIIVQGDFVYTVDWTPQLPPSKHVVVTLDDVETQDNAYVTLKGLGAQPNLLVTGGVQVFTALALRNAITTSYLIAGADLRVRFIGVNKRVDLDITW